MPTSINPGLAKSGQGRSDGRRVSETNEGRSKERFSLDLSALIRIEIADDPGSSLVPLLDLVRLSAEAIPLYRAVYAGLVPPISIEEFRSLPIAHLQDYSNLSSIDDMMNPHEELFTTLGPWNRSEPQFPRPLVCSAADYAAFVDRSLYLCEQAAITREDRVVLLVGLDQLCASANISDALAANRYSSMAILAVGDIDTIRTELAQVRPEAVFWMTRTPLRWDALPETTKVAVTFNSPTGPTGSARSYDVLHRDDVPLMAVSDESGIYHAPKGHFFFERSNQGTLVVTTLKNTLAPLIRYDTRQVCTRAQERSHL